MAETCQAVQRDLADHSSLNFCNPVSWPPGCVLHQASTFRLVYTCVLMVLLQCLKADVQAYEGCHQVWAEVLLQEWLLHPQASPAEAQEEPDVADKILSRDSLQGRALPVELQGSGCTSLELCRAAA